jgi:hypothetical protein
VTGVSGRMSRIIWFSMGKFMARKFTSAIDRVRRGIGRRTRPGLTAATHRH